MSILDGGHYMHGRFTEDQIHGEAFEELKRVFLAWDRPVPSWPAGTAFSEPRRPREWSSVTSWAILPCGVRYELLVEHLREGEPDPREVPPVVWSIMVASNGAMSAHPRIAQMRVTLDQPHHDDPSRLSDAYVGVPVGLSRRYDIGRLSRPLREDVRRVSDGWRFA